MIRVLLPFLMLALSAYAQTPEPPVEKASMVTVVIFLVMFVGSCVGYVGYVLWSARKKQDEKK
jgi:flagellar basal body-associated protein FliL